MSVAQKLSAIAGNESKVYAAGVIAGQALGGYAEGYQAGKQFQYDSFWDAYQQNGERTNYYQLFMQVGWNDTTFQPKYPIVCSGSTTNASQIFNNTRVTNISVPIIVTGVQLYRTFYNAIKLQTISMLELHDVPSFDGAFQYCTALTDLTVGGSIDVSISFSGSPQLSANSLQSIIDHLKDLTGQTTQKLTLHATTADKLTEAQKVAITAKNWTLVY